MDDEFDVFNRTKVTDTSDEENINTPEENLFESEYNDNTTVIASTNLLSNQQQQSDHSWNSTSQTNIFDDNTLDNFTSTQQTISYDDDDLSTKNEFDSYSPINLPPTADEILYSDSIKRPSVTNPVRSSTNINQIEISSTENLSPLQEYTKRRQQEIAEMEIIEKQKIEELRQQGKKDLEHWYEERRIAMEQKRQTIKRDEGVRITQSLVKSDKNTCDWSKVIRLLEFSQGTQITKQKRDLNRMRTIMIVQAKRDKDNRVSEDGV